MGKKHAAGTPPRPATTPSLPLDAGMQHASLKQLRKRAGLTQDDLATTLDVGQDTISRLEKRSDLLLSTLRHYVESIGGELTLVASFPDQPPMIIDHLGETTPQPEKLARKRAVTAHGEP